MRLVKRGWSNVHENICRGFFDGTITKHSRYPNLGDPNMAFITWLKKQKEDGVKLILWTCRTGQLLQEAIDFCERCGLTFDAVNDNLPEIKEKFGENPRKVFAHKYIDDLSTVPWAIVEPKPKPKIEPKIPMRARIVR